MSVKYWQDQIKLYDKEFESWLKRGNKVVDRYLDKRGIQPNGVETTGNSRFNILWANVETMFPAVYSKIPKPDVSRRFKDKDPAGRVASLILERCLEYEIEQYSDFDSALKNSLYDRLLPGRGTTWIRYEPTFVQGEPVTGQVSEDETAYNPDAEGYEPEQILAKECAPVDYVNWMDFGHTCAKTWEEVRGVWRKVLMDKDALEARFGQVAEERGYTIDSIPIDQAQADLEGIPEARQQDHKKAAVYEIWDKQERKVTWLCKGMDVALDERDDPLKLDEFFPCPKPLLATVSTNSLVPVPDYTQYQDQAMELDNITNRISLLVDACKVVGVYDASQEAVKRLMSEGTNNTLIPVNNWAAFGEKGGLKGVVDFLPLDMVVNTLNSLYQARDQVKAVIYEITGIADILRGQSVASETATAQQIKANYAGLRIRALQMDVARFARDLIRLKAQIICEFFSDETIISMSGAQFFSEADQQHVPQALALLRDDVNRNFRVDIESDSMVEADEEAQKQAATELLMGTGDFMQKVAPVVQQAPEMAPLFMEVFMFALRRHKISKTVEGQYQETFDKIQESMNQPKPDPAQMAQQQAEMQMQMEQQKEQARVQADMAVQQARAEADFAIAQQKMQMEAEIAQMKLDREADHKQMQAMIDAKLEEFKARLSAETQITTAQISANAVLSDAQESAADRAVDG
jgi:F0F1-type ATP synthase membrane subunit b/b'